jgi:chromosomal replication initiation ATPase DnaA
MELVKITVYFKNRSLTKLLLDTILWESLHEEKSDFSNLRIIESLVQYHNAEIETDSNRRTKSDPRARQIRLIGYDKGSSQYRI